MKRCLGPDCASFDGELPPGWELFDQFQVLDDEDAPPRQSFLCPAHTAELRVMAYLMSERK